MKALFLSLTIVMFSCTAMAATVGTVSTCTSTQSNFACPHTNDGNLLIAFVHHTGSGPSTIDWEASPLNKLASRQAHPSPFLRELEVWYLLSPAAGSSVVSVVTTSPRSLVTVVSIQDAAQSVPIVASTSGESATPSVTVNAQASDLVLDGVGIGPGVTVNSGQTQHANFDDGAWTSASSTKTGSGTLGWSTQDIPSPWAQIALVIHPLTCSATIPSHTQLFGPIQEEGAYITHPSADWTWPGSSTSSSTKKFHFPFEYPAVRFAVWRVEWRPFSVNNRLRLITMDDGPVNIATITEIAGADTSNPTAVTVVITDEINALISAKQPKSIGWQIKGGGPVTVYQSHLEFHWCLP